MNKSGKWAVIFFGTVLLLAFFLPWLNWTGTRISGFDFPAGNFFDVSGSKFDLVNPFPQFSFANYAFWLIPVLGLLSVGLTIANKKSSWMPAVTGILALSLVTVYILFTQIIIDQVGLVKSLFGSLSIGLYATIIAATGIIIASMPRKQVLVAVGVAIGPLATWLMFQLLSGQVLKSHDNTANVKSAHTLNGLEMIREFRENDSLANARYREKILTVNGRVSAIELINDSTVNIKMRDTTGSYAIFSFDNGGAKEARKLQEGDSISVKGSCSGGEYSNILGVTYITFKRSVLNKLLQ